VCILYRDHLTHLVAFVGGLSQLVGRCDDKQHGGSGKFVQFDEDEDVKECFGGSIIHSDGC